MYSWLLRNLILPSVSTFTRSAFWEAYRDMLRLEVRSWDELQRLQWERFEVLLAHACQHVPFYRERLQSRGIEPADIRRFEDLLRIPPTTKDEVQANFPDRMTSAQASKGELRYVSTSGTANRLMVIHDFHKREMVRAAALRSLSLSGGYRPGGRMVEIPPDVCSIVCGAEGESLDGVLPHLYRMVRHGELGDEDAVSSLKGRVERNWVFRKKTYQPFGPQGTSLSKEQLRGYVAALRRDRPQVLKALPTYLHEIARYVAREGLEPIPVDVVKPMGASVSPAMRESIAAGFDGAYREDYGCAEFGDMACDCARRDGLHVFSDLFLIEVVVGDRHAEPGELGRILVTDLSNLAMPMIRYAIGDVGRIRLDDHGCGRHSPRLWVEGRVEDALVDRGGEVYSSDRIMDFLYRRPEVAQFQVIETRAGCLDLLVVPRNGADLRASGLAEAFGAFLGGGMDITLYPVKTIRPEASGKFRFVQSRSWGRLMEGERHA